MKSNEDTNCPFLGAKFLQLLLLRLVRCKVTDDTEEGAPRDSVDVQVRREKCP